MKVGKEVKPAAEPVGASKPRRRAGPIKPSESKNLVASVRAVVAKVLPEMNSAFFSYMDEELLKLARDAKSNAEQSEYFAAMSNLEKAKKRVGTKIAPTLLKLISCLQIAFLQFADSKVRCASGHRHVS